MPRNLDMPAWVARRLNLPNLSDKNLIVQRIQHTSFDRLSVLDQRDIIKHLITAFPMHRAWFEREIPDVMTGYRLAEKLGQA